MSGSVCVDSMDDACLVVVFITQPEREICLMACRDVSPSDDVQDSTKHNGDQAGYGEDKRHDESNMAVLPSLGFSLKCDKCKNNLSKSSYFPAQVVLELNVMSCDTSENQRACEGPVKMR